MPRDCLYHKHLMYNAGIVVAHGDILMIGDSDAMVRPGFIAAILEAFEARSQPDPASRPVPQSPPRPLPLRLSELRGGRGEGRVKQSRWETRGVPETEGLPSSIAAITGPARPAAPTSLPSAAPTSIIDYGHTCGRRLPSAGDRGYREVLHDSESTDHTWHPGEAGEDSYQGPHHGRQL